MASASRSCGVMCGLDCFWCAFDHSCSYHMETWWISPSPTNLPTVDLRGQGQDDEDIGGLPRKHNTVSTSIFTFLYCECGPSKTYIQWMHVKDFSNSVVARQHFACSPWSYKCDFNPPENSGFLFHATKCSEERESSCAEVYHFIVSYLMTKSCDPLVDMWARSRALPWFHIVVWASQFYVT